MALGQMVIDGFVFSSIIILGSIGLSLVYAIANFPNFAHGDLMAVGAYVAIVVNVMLGLHLGIALIVAMLATGIIAVWTNRAIFKPLEGRAIELLIISIGVAFLYRGVIQLGFGSGSRSYDVGGRGGIPWIRDMFGVALTLRGLSVIVITAILVLALHIMLQYTTLGRMMRATADNKDLARVSGIRTDDIIRTMWLVGGALAGAGGVFLGLALLVRPRMGFAILLVLFAAVILGGIGSIYGAVLGGFVIGMAYELTPALGNTFEFINGYLPYAILPEIGSEYKAAVAFIIMILILLIKPTGIMGGKTSA